MEKQPNFLFIMTDQLRVDHTGFGGNEIVQTPHLDRLAEQSRQFNRTYCTNPMCGPSRASIFTGRMPSAHGNWANILGLDWYANTFVRVLREDGYQTGLIGKSHLQEFMVFREVLEERPNVSLDMPHPSSSEMSRRFPQKGEGAAVRPPLPADWNQWENQARHREGYLELPSDYYGFDRIELMCSHADLPEGHYRHWFIEQGGDVATMGGYDNAPRRSEVWKQVYCSNMPAELYPTSYITERSIDALETFARQDSPFFLTVSYPDPHHPFCPPEPYYDMYQDINVPLPDTFYDTHERSMPHFQRVIKQRGRDFVGAFMTSPTEAQYQAAAAAEYGSITMIDDGIGRILQTLEATGQADNTVIIFCSDHGDMFGDHGMMLKIGSHYDGTVRVPLFIKAPDVEPGRSDSLVSLMDLAPTILDFAGLQPYIGMQGINLQSILADPTTKTRDHVYIEEDLPIDLIDLEQNTSIRTLITEDTRLTVYRGAPHGELFNLDEDPTEMQNLFGQAEASALQAEMTHRLVNTMIDHRNIVRPPKLM